MRCGKFGHKAGDKKADGTSVCTARCGECGSRLCTGCRDGGVCVVIADEMPSIDDLRNGAGFKYDPKVYQILAEYRKKKRGELGMTVKTARVDMAVGDDNDSAEPEGDVYDQYHVL
jgi:hypothetical protein